LSNHDIIRLVIFVSKIKVGVMGFAINFSFNILN
jgi:hypothetical protein